MSPKRSGDSGDPDIRFGFVLTGEKEAGRIAQILKNMTRQAQTSAGKVEAAYKRIGEATNEAFGTRPTGNTKSRLRKGKGKVSSDEMTESLERIGKSAKKTTGGLQRLFFSLGLLRFGINVANFAFQTFLGFLQVDAIRNYDQAVNFARATMQDFHDITEDTANVLIDMVNKGFGDRKDLITQVLGDPRTLHLITLNTPEAVRLVGELATKARDLEGIDSKAFFDGLLKVLQGDAFPGAIDEFIALFDFAPGILKLLKEGDQESILKAFSDRFASAVETDTIKLQTKLDELKATWQEFSAEVLIPIAIPALTFALDRVKEVFTEIKDIFSLDSPDFKSVAVAVATAGSLLGFFFIGTLVGGPVVGILGAIGAALLVTKIRRFFEGDDEWEKLETFMEETGARIGKALVDAYFRAMEEVISKFVPADIAKPIIDGVNLGIDAINQLIVAANKIPGNVLGLAPVLGPLLGGGPKIPLADKVGEQIVEDTKKKIGINTEPIFTGSPSTDPFFDPEFGFADNGLVVPGPRGAPQMIIAHGGETILPTHKNGSGSSNLEVTLMIDKRVLGQVNIDLLNTFARQHAVMVPGSIGG